MHQGRWYFWIASCIGSMAEEQATTLWLKCTWHCGQPSASMVQPSMSLEEILETLSGRMRVRSGLPDIALQDGACVSDTLLCPCVIACGQPLAFRASIQDQNTTGGSSQLGNLAIIQVRNVRQS